MKLFLFVLTFFSLTFKEFLLGAWLVTPPGTMKSIFYAELPYSASLLLILLAHEMGHYLPARYYGVKATLPYFIPFPMQPIGTMGAVIKIESPIPDKRKLFDIGAGGPIMSLLLSLLCYVCGLYFSKLTPLQGASFENSIFFGDSLLTHWIGQWILGPYDPKQFDILIHPLAKAGWVGLLITAINLIPFGQLDGGHIIYSVFGEKYRTWIHYLFLGFLILSLFNFGWLIWAFLIYYFIKIEHPFVPNTFDGNIGVFRKSLGIFLLISIFFIFVPNPIYFGVEKDAPNLIQFLMHRFFQ